MKSRIARAGLAFAAIFALTVGCGGGGGGGNQASVGFLQAVFVWDEHSPAKSVVVTLQNSNPDGTDHTFMPVNRPAGTGTQTQTVPFTDQVLNGPHPLNSVFHQDSNGMGPVVAAAQSTATVVTTPTPATTPTITTSAVTIASVQTLPGQSVVVGQQRDFLVSASDVKGNIVAIPASAMSFTVTPGTGNLSITVVNGEVFMVGVSVGTVTVKATVNGVTGPPETVTVTDRTYPDVSALVAQGRALINDLVRGETVTNAQNLQIARDIFMDAYTKNPGDTQANFGFSISAVAYRAQVLYDRTQGRASGDDNSTLNEAANRAVLWKTPSLGGSFASDALRLMLAAPYVPADASRAARLSRAVDPDQLRTAMSDLKSALDMAIPAAEFAASKPDFTFAIADYHSGAAAGSTLTVDQGDVQAYLTALYLVRAIANIALSYDFHWGTFDFRQPIKDKFGAPLATGRLLKPDDYWPPSPFGMLLSDGTARFNAAQGDLSVAADRGAAALTTLQNRAVKTGHLLNATGWDFAAINRDIGKFKNALTQKYTQTVVLNRAGKNRYYATVTLTLNLNTWFASPPPSLRALLPTYHAQAPDQNGSQYVNASVADYPDKTLGGLLDSPPDAAFVVWFNTYARIGDLSSYGFPVLRIFRSFDTGGSGSVTIK